MTKLIRKTGAEAWLRGTWRSNRKKTLAGWIWPPGSKGKEFRRILEPAFGKLTIKYTPTRLHSRSDGVDFVSEPYRVAWKSEGDLNALQLRSKKIPMLIGTAGNGDVTAGHQLLRLA